MATHSSIIVLENASGQRAWWAVGHRVAKNPTQLKHLARTQSKIFIFRIITLKRDLKTLTDDPHI